MHNVHIRGYRLCLRSYYFQIGIWICSDSVVIFYFHFITYVRIHMPITLIRHSFVNLSHDTMLKDT